MLKSVSCMVIALSCMLSLPARACPNMLIGDSLAEGMAPYAQADGYEVISQRGAGISWLRAQAPRCVDTLVIVIGTNDLPSMSADWARAYPGLVSEVVRWWRPQRAIWATPACFLNRPWMERASAWVNAAAEISGDLEVHRGRPARCSIVGGDGIHPPASVYRAWWRDIRS